MLLLWGSQGDNWGQIFYKTWSWLETKPAWVKFRAPRDPAALSRPCLLCRCCTCSFCDRAGGCPPLRTPWSGSSADCAGRCSPLKTPCTGSFADCAGRYFPLHLPSALHCPSIPPRARFPPPMIPPPSPSGAAHFLLPLPCCRLSRMSAPTGCRIRSLFSLFASLSSHYSRQHDQAHHRPSNVLLANVSVTLYSPRLPPRLCRFAEFQYNPTFSQAHQARNIISHGGVASRFMNT